MVVFDVFSNGDLLLKNKQHVELDQVNSLMDVLVAVRNQCGPHFSSTRAVFTLEGIEVVTLAQLRDGSALVAASDTKCLPRIHSAVQSYRGEVVAKRNATSGGLFTLQSTELGQLRAGRDAIHRSSSSVVTGTDGLNHDATSRTPSPAVAATVTPPVATAPPPPVLYPPTPSVTSEVPKDYLPSVVPVAPLGKPARRRGLAPPPPDEPEVAAVPASAAATVGTPAWDSPILKQRVLNHHAAHRDPSAVCHALDATAAELRKWLDHSSSTPTTSTAMPPPPITITDSGEDDGHKATAAADRSSRLVAPSFSDGEEEDATAESRDRSSSHHRVKSPTAHQVKVGSRQVTPKAKSTSSSTIADRPPQLKSPVSIEKKRVLRTSSATNPREPTISITLASPLRSSMASPTRRSALAPTEPIGPVATPGRAAASPKVQPSTKLPATPDSASGPSRGFHSTVATVMIPQLEAPRAAVNRRGEATKPRPAPTMVSHATAVNAQPSAIEAWTTLHRDWCTLVASQGVPVSHASSKVHRVLFRDTIAAAVKVALRSVGIDDDDETRGPADIKAAFIGPEGSGRLRVMAIAAEELLLPHLKPVPLTSAGSADDGDAPAVMVYTAPFLTIPLAANVMLPDAQTDAAVWFCRFVQQTVSSLAAVYSPVRPVASTLSAYFKSAVTRRGSLNLVDPRVARAFPEGATATWMLLCGAIQTAYVNGEYDDFVLHTLRIPQAFREALNMTAVVYFIEDLDALSIKTLVDWRTGNVITNVDLCDVFLAHAHASRTTGILFSTLTLPLFHPLEHSQAKMAKARRMSSTARPWRGMHVSMCGLVPDAVACSEAGLPAWFVCGRRRFPLSIFGGCPGFLATIARHVQQSLAVRPSGVDEVTILDPGLAAVLEELELLRL